MKDHNCTVCPITKQTRLPFPTSVSISNSCFDIVHVDVWGSYMVPNYDGKRYFLTLVDDKSRYTWIFLMHTKSDSIVLLRDFLCMVKTQFETTIKCIRLDNGTEFFNSQVDALFREHGILHQSSYVHSPQQNGVVERKHRSILDMARALRFQACIPIIFWGMRVSTAVYILNRLPTMLLKSKSSCEMLFGHAPSLSHLRVLGSLCYATDPKRLDKFAPRSIPAIHMGYSFTQKGYILYDFNSKTFFVSRDTVFKEEIFPFKDLKSYHDPLFPIITLPDDSVPKMFVLSSPSSSQSPTPVRTDVPSKATASENVVPFVAPPRRSSRQSKPHVWLDTYVTPKAKTACLYPISTYVSYSNLSPAYRVSLAAYSATSEPHTYSKACQDPFWVAAMHDEITAFESNGTWSIVSLPTAKVAIGCK